MGGFAKQTVKDIDLAKKRVLLRVDYNVPLTDSKQVADDYRIAMSIPTINYLLEQECKVVIMSHLGRPDGKVDPDLSLAPVVPVLRKLLHGVKVDFVDDCIGEKVTKQIKKMKSGQVLLLENTRFHTEEEANDDQFASQLAKNGKIFVQDCFGAVHRSHASTVGVTKHLPSVAGLLVEKEINTITKAMEQPERPLMAIIGGAKISDKIDLIKRFIEIADFVALGGAMANTFLAAEGYNIGKSLYEPEQVKNAKQILKLARTREKEGKLSFYVPMDGVVAKSIDSTAATRIVDWGSRALADMSYYPKTPPIEAYTIAEDEMILDIGPFSAAYIAGAIQACKTVVWNGTLGMTEIYPVRGHDWGPFEIADIKIHESITGLDGRRPFSIVGGGDTASYVMGLDDHELYGHISTGGGASMYLMSGKKLPGVEALLDKE